ncbi:MAG: lysylphosphatidylglycerol synthase transmembrane domain-containing protein [Candidatus Saccharibacteria bacterium]
MKFRTWLNVITVFLLALVVFFGWKEIVRAWGVMGDANLFILAIMVPIQIFSYYAVGEIIFSYLRSRGNLKDTSRWQMARMALELNFVNHILPSGGAAGFSYLGWVLSRHGVSAGRATMAQIVRFSLSFVSFVVMLVLAVLFLFFDQKINKFIVIISAVLVVAVIIGIILMIYIIGNRGRLTKFAGWLTNTVNRVVFKFTRGKKRQVMKLEVIENFFGELHQDYLEIRREKKILIKPLLWAILVHVLDVGLVLIAFLALGSWVNPATLFIAFGLSSIVSVFSGTLGGTGVYEAVMVAFLASAGIAPDVAIAGTLLARALLLVGTILFGFVFYQLTLNKYGKAKN